MAEPNGHPHRLRRLLLIAALVTVPLALAVWGIRDRVAATDALQRETEEAAIASVAVGHPTAAPASDEVVLPGTVQAWVEAPIYARTSGYLKSWKTDIGARVKAGDLLAEIDTPEVDQQLAQARADLATAIANNQLAQSTARRWKALLATNSVSAQETDEKVGDAAAKAAAQASAAANVARLEQLEDFKRVLAPFDGVVTARETDIGQLITAGSSGPRELFRVADTTRLRIYVQVPQPYAGAITADLPVELTFAEHPGRSFAARLARTADALDPTARTLLIELQADNAKGELMPGGYTTVHLKLPSRNPGVRLPASALLFRAEGLRVATVEPGDRVMLRPIVLGRDFGSEVEILSGLSPEQSVILDPPDSLADDERVRVVTPPPAHRPPPMANGKSS